MATTPNDTNPTLVCFRCNETYCFNDAKPSAFRALLCPNCGKSLIRSKATLLKFLWDKYGAILIVLAAGISYSYINNMHVTSPDRVLSAPQKFESKPFEFRYVDLTNIQILSEDRDKTLVGLNLSIQDKPFTVYSTVSKPLFQELKQQQWLYTVKGNYDEKSNLYILTDVTISSGWWGSLVAFPYGVTRMIFDHPIAIMTADFSLWFILCTIWTLFRMLLPEWGKQLADDALDAAD